MKSQNLSLKKSEFKMEERGKKCVVSRQVQENLTYIVLKKE